MSNNVKGISIKNYTYNFFDDTINIKDFDPNNNKIDERSYKNIVVNCIAYVSIKHSKYVKINSLNPLYLNENKYLKLVLTDENKEKIKKVSRTVD